jgi:hypothetical protein
MDTNTANIIAASKARIRRMAAEGLAISAEGLADALNANDGEAADFWRERVTYWTTLLTK